MIITGPPRSGTTLMLMLLAGTVSNKEVMYGQERMHGAEDRRVISKEPKAAWVYQGKGKKIDRPLYMIRDPRAVMTSAMRINYRLTSEHRKYWVGAMVCHSPTALNYPGLLPAYYTSLDYPDAWFRYEDLVTDPDLMQERVGEYWGLEYRRSFSEYPFDDLRAPKKMERALNDTRPIDNGHDWRDHLDRVRYLFDAFPALHDAMEGWGYEKDKGWYDEVLDLTDHQRKEPLYPPEDS